MQEVNSLCTDSRALRADCCIVGIPHYTSHLVNSLCHYFVSFYIIVDVIKPLSIARAVMQRSYMYYYYYYYYYY